MSQEEYLKDISEIKNLMNKSSKFISLSGLSGILAGVYALIGAGYYYFVNNKTTNNLLITNNKLINTATVIIITVVILTAITTLYFTSKRTKITNEKLWDVTSKNILKAYLTSLSFGAMFIAILYFKENYTYLISLVFIFYGLALINAATFTNNQVKPLGFIEIIVGLLCAITPAYSFWFWLIGFGVVHIIYGAIIYFKFDKK